jgi:hypothetical protein
MSTVVVPIPSVDSFDTKKRELIAKALECIRECVSLGVSVLFDKCTPYRLVIGLGSDKSTRLVVKPHSDHVDTLELRLRMKGQWIVVEELNYGSENQGRKLISMSESSDDLRQEISHLASGFCLN